MNENPGGTPNPLNPNPAGPAPTPVQPVAQPVPPVNPAPQPTPTVEPAAPVATPEPTMPAEPTTTVSPADRPMEQAAPAPEPKKKKKTGLIVGIIIAVVLLIGGGIAAAIILMNMNKIDPVTAAMNKIMSGNAPSNVAIDGNINVAINNDLSPVSNVKISLDSKFATSSAINNSVAKVTATIRNVGDFSVEFDEVYAGNGDLYFKIDGATSALEDSGILYLLNLANQMPNVVDCGDDAICQTTEIEELTCDNEEECNLIEIDDTEFNVLSGGQNVLDVDTISYFASMTDVVEVIDGEWLKISVDEMNMLTGGMVNSSDVSCITNLVSDINTNSNSAAELYKKYPFITATNKDVHLASKQYPVYQVSIDSKNFADYVNSIQNSEMTVNLYSCLGWTNNISVSYDDVTEIVDAMPKFYVEVDSENNFTRLYLASDLNDDEATITIDLGFSYSNNINVAEPEEYRNFSDVIQEIMSSIYNLSNDTTDTTIEVDTVNLVDN